MLLLQLLIVSDVVKVGLLAIGFLLLRACSPESYASKPVALAPKGAAASGPTSYEISLNDKWELKLKPREEVRIAVSRSGLLALARGKRLEVLNGTGQILWNDSIKSVWTNDLAWSEDGTRLYLLTVEDLFTYDSNGILLNRAESPSLGGIGTPTSHGNLFISSGHGQLHCYSKMGELLWQFDEGGRFGSLPYTTLSVRADGSACFVGMLDEKRMYRPLNVDGLIAYLFSPDGQLTGAFHGFEPEEDGVWLGDRIYGVVGQKPFATLTACDERGQTAWSTRLPVGIYEQPLIVGGRLWLVGAYQADGYLLIVDLDGKIQKEVDFKSLEHPCSYISDPQLLDSDVVSFVTHPGSTAEGGQWLWIFSGDGEILYKRAVSESTRVIGAGQCLAIHDYLNGKLVYSQVEMNSP